MRSKSCKFKIVQFLIFFAVVLVPSEIFAQKSVKPTILRKVISEKKRDPKLEAAIVKEAKISQGDEIRYYYNQFDLNGDKKPEVLVYLFGNAVCGTGGCNALLLRRTTAGYKQVAFFGPVRNPIIVSQNKTNGWNDLIFFNSGGGIVNGYYSVCRFKGKTYPENPTVLEDAPPLKTRIKGVSYLEGTGDENSGLQFSFKKQK